MVKNITVLFLLLLSLDSSLAQNATTNGNGAWDNPLTWSTGAIPDSGTNVLIQVGDTVVMPDAGTHQFCNNLTIQNGAALILRSRNLTVSGNTEISGMLADTINQGNDAFLGNVHIQAGGIFNTEKVTSANRVIFFNGLRHNGSTCLINRAAFAGNDQVVDGSEAVRFERNVNIGPGITVRNQNTAGMYFDNGVPQAGDSLSTLTNESLMYFSGNGNVMEGGQLDGSPVGNRIFYNRGGVQNIGPFTYHELELIAPADQNNVKRRMNSGLRVISKLIINENMVLEVNGGIGTVEDSLMLLGEINASTPGAGMDIKHLVMLGGLLDGNNDPGTLQMEELIGVGLNNRIQDVLLDVSQKVIAEEAGEVIFDSDLFAFQVGGMEVKEGGVIRDDRGLSVTATGPVIIDGTLLVDEAMYTFEDLVSVRDSGNLVPNRATAVVRFLGGLRNNGNLQLANNDVFGAGIFDGDIPIVVGDLLIRDGDSLIIENTAGLFISDSLEGEGPDAVLVNRSRIEFGSGIQTYVPMDQGELDLSFAGNTVAYVSTRANQVIRRAEYMNLEVSENTKVLSDGNISLRGNLILGADINKNPDLFDAGPIRFIGEQAQQIMGEGIVPSIEVDKTGGSLQVVDDIVIRESFIMTNGITNANPGVIGLLGGATLVETEASYVAGTVASQRNIDAGGANSFGGIGIKIRAAGSQPMGITTVLRHTDMPVLPGHIERYFEIQPTNNENLDAVVEFSYFQREITGAVEADLDIMHSPNNDGNFERLGGQVFQVSNFIRRSNIDVLGTISVSPVSVAVLGYPSPFTEELNVDYVVEKDELVRFSLIDMAGRAVVRETLQARAGKNTYLINRPDLRAGIYFLHISSSDNEGYRKVVKVNP